MKRKSSASKKTAPPAAAKDREAHDPSKMQLQIMEHSPSSAMSRSPIKLPPGWVVEQRPRVNSAAHPGRVDRYYYEPKSGRQFRSLTAVQRYLYVEMESTLTTQRVKPGNKNSMQIVPHVFRSGTPFKLPPGWVVEEKPRSNLRYAGVVDRVYSCLKACLYFRHSVHLIWYMQFYIEPGTGRRFRSMLAVERYLAEMEASAGASKHSRDSGSRKKQKSGVEVDPMLDFTTPPAKVKWVHGGPGGSLWNPFMSESVVPEFVQKTWSEMFILSIEDKF
ncbi:hypothetical protein PTKIN_Ptkin11bG0022500 [Pterospermum kingtungense]